MSIVKKSDNKIIKSGLPMILQKNKGKDPLPSDNSYLSTNSQSMLSSSMNNKVQGNNYSSSIMVISDIKSKARNLDLDLNNL